MKKKLITIITPCFNEEGNVEELYRRIKEVMVKLPQYDYEHLYIDNASTDHTETILRKIAAEDSNVKLIFNNRNFGHIRSPSHALLSSKAEATIILASDLQDPPELILEFITHWENGFKVVLGQKNKSEEFPLFYFIRTLYYKLVTALAEIALMQHVTGFGLYDKDVIDQLRSLNDKYPYFRGLISELGYRVALVPYCQPSRKKGITKNNFYSLFDYAMLGITSHSKVPLRLATMFGFLMSFLCILVAVGYFIDKLLYWQSLPVGIAPIVIGLFLLASIQLFFIGVLGEYIGAIYTQTLNRPLVVERERVNFK
ncbi:MAG: glycosyltransferase family 2 protein [Chthoniobacterales bacterium]|nr:glycosyltransferase family 2 protein [Chthoniobacterales bacterium]